MSGNNLTTQVLRYKYNILFIHLLVSLNHNPKQKVSREHSEHIFQKCFNTPIPTYKTTPRAYIGAFLPSTGVRFPAAKTNRRNYVSILLDITR